MFVVARKRAVLEREGAGYSQGRNRSLPLAAASSSSRAGGIGGASQLACAWISSGMTLGVLPVHPPPPNRVDFAPMWFESLRDWQKIRSSTTPPPRPAFQAIPTGGGRASPVE